MAAERDALALLLMAQGGQTSMRNVLVTGGNKGIGLQICKKIVQTVPDARVLLGSRSISRGEKAVQDVIDFEPSAAGRVELVQLDVADEASVQAAAKAVADMFPHEEHPLYGICNNAGIGFGRSIPETLETNFYGTKHVCETFLPLLNPTVGRICNIASASGPNYVSGLDAEGKHLFTSRQTSWEELETALKKAAAGPDRDAYGLSKAAVNQWTMQFAAAHPNLRVNSCSPGYILTDLTRGMGASTKPEKSNCHVAALFLLFGDVPQPSKNLGRYYGSDAVRSPIDRYRGPGDPPYVGD
jgi:NAD(P)-dependent dehydrogenase (short-subunit alcohol dehydrogenase family)